MGTPKYSIILPVKNGMPYLKTAVNSVLSQEFRNFELILSVDASQDSSWNFVQQISDSRVRIFQPPTGLTMTEHWEWALSLAGGEWIIFLGQDDALQLYFFDLAEKLIAKASNKGIKVICSRRAYLFWPGTENLYPDQRFTYRAANLSSVRNLSADVHAALTGTKTYFELPTMYTSSLFNKSVLEFARNRQEGRVFTCHPQDANLAALAFASESQYLRTEIPLGWVGTSTKSAGLAIAEMTHSEGRINSHELEELGHSYLNSINTSTAVYDLRAGNFAIDDPKLYFWQALLKSEKLLSQNFNQSIRTKNFKYRLFSAVWSNLVHSGNHESKRTLILEAIKTNNLSVSKVRFLSIYPSVRNVIRPKLMKLAWKVVLIISKPKENSEKFVEEVVSTSDNHYPSFEEFNTLIARKYNSLTSVTTS